MNEGGIVLCCCKDDEAKKKEGVTFLEHKVPQMQREQL
jgi:hypothetical protein